MAFHMPTAQVQRPRPRVSTGSSSQLDSYFNVQSPIPLEESQEWVLFSPNPPSTTTRTISASTIHTQRTTGASRLSDFGSLNTRGRSASLADTEEEAEEDDVYSPYPNDDEDELESLDSHLPAFKEPSLYQSKRNTLIENSIPVLPQHDGLGLFPASSSNVQEHIFQFEQFNPKRISTQQGPLRSEEYDRFSRIHSWRLEQSQALLDEVEKETRRRRLSRSTTTAKPDVEEEEATLNVSQFTTSDETVTTSVVTAATADSEKTDSFWKRITRRVIRDLIGIDDNLLSVIFGESLPEDATGDINEDELPATVPDFSDVRSWEERLLERIAVELGTLVSQLSEHPGAFTSYMKAQLAPDYVGMTRSPLSTVSGGSNNHRLSVRDLRSESQRSAGHVLDSSPFKPTLRGRSFDDLNLHASGRPALWEINEGDENREVDVGSDEAHSHQSEALRLKRQREHWERELDVKVVFGFFRNRLASKPDSFDLQSSSKATWATATSQRSAARAAAIRHHHPLAYRGAHKSHVTKTWYQHHNTRRPSSPLASNSSIPAPNVLRRGSSCASLSTRVSGRRGSGSSRNYWDIGGSAGSARGGSAVIAGGSGWGDI